MQLSKKSRIFNGITEGIDNFEKNCQRNFKRNCRIYLKKKTMEFPMIFPKTAEKFPKESETKLPKEFSRNSKQIFES